VRVTTIAQLRLRRQTEVELTDVLSAGVNPQIEPRDKGERLIILHHFLHHVWRSRLVLIDISKATHDFFENGSFGNILIRVHHLVVEIFG
jgi:hypothetical protein